MIKLGIRYSRNILQTTGIQIDLRSSGGIIFYGSGIMGCGSNIITRKEGIIEFGKNFGISGNFSVCSLSKIEIGNNLSCSWNVSIYDTDFHEMAMPTSHYIKRCAITQLEYCRGMFISEQRLYRLSVTHIICWCASKGIEEKNSTERFENNSKCV